MNRDEAKAILSRELRVYRKHQYSELLYLLKSQDTKEVIGASGKKYQLEFQAELDDSKSKDLRVMGAIDDLGFRAFAHRGRSSSSQSSIATPGIFQELGNVVSYLCHLGIGNVGCIAFSRLCRLTRQSRGTLRDEAARAPHFFVGPPSQIRLSLLYIRIYTN